MKINTYLLWALWFVMLGVMIWKWKFDSHMVVALIVLPILMSILEIHEELNQIREEGKHQRKFVLDRYNALTDKVTEVTNQLEKRLVVDFEEFARSNPQPFREPPRKKRRKSRQIPGLDLTGQTTQSLPDFSSGDDDDAAYASDTDSDPDTASGPGSDLENGNGNGNDDENPSGNEKLDV